MRIIENGKIAKSGRREETIVSKVRTDPNFSNFFHLASTAAISLLFAIVVSCCVTVSAGEFSLSKPVLFEGAVDGSAAADVGDGFFVGATDEDNEFRLYDVKGGLSPRKLDVGVEAAVKGRARRRKNQGVRPRRRGQNWRPDLLDWFPRAKQKCAGEKRTPGPVRNET